MFYAVIVIYNKKISESITFNCFKTQKDIKIIICDNSDIQIENSFEMLPENVSYLKMNGNEGLAKAYNKAILSIQEEGYVGIFDDDTYLTDEYFAYMRNEIENKTADILLPIVKSGEKIISPMNSLITKKILAINSGMCVNTSCYKQIRYDENLFLDAIDLLFIREAQKNNFKIKRIDCEIKQTFSEDVKNKKYEKVRYNIWKKDRKYYRKARHLSFLYYIDNILRKIKLIKKYNDINCLFW